MTFIVASKSGVALVATGSLFIYAAGGLRVFFAVNGIAFFTFDFIFCMPISFGFPNEAFQVVSILLAAVLTPVVMIHYFRAYFEELLSFTDASLNFS